MLYFVFSSLFHSPLPALESTFTQFNSDTRTVSFMADHACVFSIKPGSCTLFIWETIILMAQQKLMESRLGFFSGRGIGKTHSLEVCQTSGDGD